MVSTNSLGFRPAKFAKKALLYELALTPSPGLVDRANAGSHTDMNFFVFLDSALALGPYLDKYYQAGLVHQGDLKELFERLRYLGAQAEEAMFQATQGINTHKGINFSLALVLGATGYHQLQEPRRMEWSAGDTQQIFSYVTEMVDGLIAHDFQDLESKETLTHGERLYRDHGIKGIRGQAEAGYPDLSQHLLPYWRQLKVESLDSYLLRGLVLLMSVSEDSNLLHRGGYEAWQRVQAESQSLIDQELSDADLRQQLQDYDQALIERKLSPGGSADLLALGIYFALLEGILPLSPDGE